MSGYVCCCHEPNERSLVTLAGTEVSMYVQYVCTYIHNYPDAWVRRRLQRSKGTTEADRKYTHSDVWNRCGWRILWASLWMLTSEIHGSKWKERWNQGATRYSHAFRCAKLLRTRKVPSHRTSGPAATFAPSLSFHAGYTTNRDGNLYALGSALTCSFGLLGSLYRPFWFADSSFLFLHISLS